MDDIVIFLTIQYVTRSSTKKGEPSLARLPVKVYDLAAYAAALARSLARMSAAALGMLAPGP